MRLIFLLSLVMSLCCCHSASVFIRRKVAHEVLTRIKRANSGWFEELKVGDLERECIEEKCSYEEAREVFEHTEATNEFWNNYNGNVKNLCLTSPCENNGTCTQMKESYACLCKAGFYGRNCEHAIKLIPDSCLDKNGGCEHFCEEEKGRRNCSCADGYFLGPDEQSCLTHETFPCGKVPLLNTSLSGKNVDSDQRARIVGGAECPRGHCPWQVLLMYGTKGFCGGVIYKPTWILTASHCLEKIVLKDLKIVTGEHDLDLNEGSEQTIEVEQVIKHPNYVSATADNDIALLRLRRPIVYNTYAVPVCLPRKIMAERELWRVRYHTVSGWGRRSETGPTSRILRRLKVPRIHTQDCVRESNVALTLNMFCAGYLEGKEDSCKGDSGGPLVTSFGNTTFLLGIVSWGKGCARPGHYGIYTRVSNYLEWIHTHTSALKSINGTVVVKSLGKNV